MKQSIARLLPVAVMPAWHDAVVVSNPGAAAFAAAYTRAARKVASTASGPPV